MKPALLATAITLASICLLPAQSSPVELDANDQPAPDAVADAIRRFQESRNTPGKSNEVVVDLTQSDEPEAAKQPPAEKPAAPPPAPKPDPAPTPPAAEPAPPVPVPKEGLTVKVERLQTGNGTIDPASVKLLAPFPVKPLGPIPPGWKLDSSADAPAFTRDVELAPKSSITLTIKPHVLVPDANGASAFSVSEPGFDPADGYRQLHTVGAVLARSLDQLDEDSKQLGTAVEQLQQLVSALPKPSPKPATATGAKPLPAAKPASKR